MLQVEPAPQIAIIAATVVGLWLGARLLVDAAVRLARRVGLSELTIGLTIVAAGTSMPELVVTTDAAMKGLGDIAVGNAVGSSIYNLAFVLGMVALLQVLPIRRSLVRRDGVLLLAGTVLAAATVLDLRLSRLEGGFLIGAFVAYTGLLLRQGSVNAAGTAPPTETAGAPPPPTADPSGPAGLFDRLSFPGRDVVALLVGVAIVLVSGDLLVEAATVLARSAGVSEWVIGGTIVAAGTSTPEFAVSLVAIRAGQLGVSIGNVFGSNLFNLLPVMGVAAVVQPLALSTSALTGMAWLFVVSVVLVVALWTGRQLSRPEGGLFVTSEVVRWTTSLLGVG